MQFKNNLSFLPRIRCIVVPPSLHLMDPLKDFFHNPLLSVCNNKNTIKLISKPHESWRDAEQKTSQITIHSPQFIKPLNIISRGEKERDEEENSEWHHNTQLKEYSRWWIGGFLSCLIHEMSRKKRRHQYKGHLLLARSLAKLVYWVTFTYLILIILLKAHW